MARNPAKLLERLDVKNGLVSEAERAVITSTVWPLESLVFSGASLRSTRAATARLPMSVCTA